MTLKEMEIGGGVAILILAAILCGVFFYTQRAPSAVEQTTVVPETASSTQQVQFTEAQKIDRLRALEMSSTSTVEFTKQQKLDRLKRLEAASATKK